MKSARALQLAGAIAAMVTFFALWAVIGGLIKYSGDWLGPLVVNFRSTRLVFNQAWTYLGPALAILAVAAVTMFGCLVTLVRRPHSEQQ